MTMRRRCPEAASTQQTKVPSERPETGSQREADMPLGLDPAGRAGRYVAPYEISLFRFVKKKSLLFPKMATERYGLSNCEWLKQETSLN